jgi:hypothetical protein
VKVLIACEFSGTVRDAFAARGHDAWSCDILPTERPGNHIQGDVLEVLNEGWDLMIAFPPCTHLAVSGAAHFEAKRKDGRQQQGIDFFLALTRTKIPQWAIENPIGIMSSYYRTPDQIVQPYYFGDPERKPTCLWLNNLPALWWSSTPTLFGPETAVEPNIVTLISKNTGRKLTYSAFEYKASMNHKERAKLRSVTFPGVAAAMASQWSD